MSGSGWLSGVCSKQSRVAIEHSLKLSTPRQVDPKRTGQTSNALVQTSQRCTEALAFTRQ